jgi:lipopolysaccharide biosynthesis glycosyltransferase
MIKVFIGYDERETIAAHVLHHSIQRKSSMPVQVSFLNRDMLRGIFTRPRGPLESTDFSISRFLVPYLCNYQGWAIFMDCDMVCRDDIAKLWAWRDEHYAVMCVKHVHVPTEDKKFLEAAQTKYVRKNWSSMMLLNCASAACKTLTREYVNEAPGLALHQFEWCEGNQIGDIPHHWNHLVGYDKYDHKAALAHFTSGGPYFDDYRHCDYHEDWRVENALLGHVADD